MAKVYPTIEYLTSDRCYRVRPTDKELCIMRRLEAYTGPEYELFFKPFINGLRPSMVLYRPEAGILIVDLLNRQDFLRKADPKERFLKQKFELFKLAVSPAEQKEHETALTRAISGLCLVDADTEEVTKHYQHIRYYSVMSYDDFFREGNLDRLLRGTKLHCNTAFTISHILLDIRRLLKPSLHRLEEGRSFTPNVKQRKLMQSQPGTQRTKGVAGSGKTATIAHKAVNANKRHESEVLILCFNITIRHYIRNKIEDVMAKFIWSDFHITHYHDLFKHQSIQYLKKRPHIGDWEDEEYFERVKDELPKYSTIIIDEAQDYRRQWVVILMKYFLKEEGEIAVFFDVNQDIYERKEVATFPIPGRPNEMNKSYRLSTNISMLCNRFLRHFRLDEEEDGGQIEVTKEQMNFDYSEFKSGISYHKLEKNAAVLSVYQLINQRMKQMGVSPDDVAVLGTSIAKLRELEQVFRQGAGQLTTRMFESEEEHNELAKRHNPLTDQKNYRIKLREIRREYKLWKFNLRTGLTKFCSVHSFKGWEIHTVFLLLTSEEEHDEEPESTVRHRETSWQLIYTGMSRARNELNIINLGNEKYHDFFLSEEEEEL